MPEITPKQVADMTEKSLGIKFIITGLAHLVEDEGFTPHEALSIARYTGNNCFHALAELNKESK
ncbi:hypothetical protein MTP04_02310 [Lysinibacillus sp. PLM2]|nr:hypothetical protein MTP04_02310 [Lysinibacillus sp. PLM2]